MNAFKNGSDVEKLPLTATHNAVVPKMTSELKQRESEYFGMPETNIESSTKNTVQSEVLSNIAKEKFITSQNNSDIIEGNPNRYSISNSPIVIDETLEKKDFHQLKSFTDEEILESIEYLLDQNPEKNDKHSDMSVENQENKIIDLTSKTQFLGADLNEEFSKLRDKYGKTENLQKLPEIRTRTFEKNTTIGSFSRNPTVSRKGKLHSGDSFENALFVSINFSCFKNSVLIKSMIYSYHRYVSYTCGDISQIKHTDII